MSFSDTVADDETLRQGDFGLLSGMSGEIGVAAGRVDGLVVGDEACCCACNRLRSFCDIFGPKLTGEWAGRSLS